MEVVQPKNWFMMSSTALFETNFVSRSRKIKIRSPNRNGIAQLSELISTDKTPENCFEIAVSANNKTTGETIKKAFLCIVKEKIIHDMEIYRKLSEELEIDDVLTLEEIASELIKSRNTKTIKKNGKK